MHSFFFLEREALGFSRSVSLGVHDIRFFAQRRLDIVLDRYYGQTQLPNFYYYCQWLDTIYACVVLIITTPTSIYPIKFHDTEEEVEERRKKKEEEEK